jgi:hypothetical protein
MRCERQSSNEPIPLLRFLTIEAPSLHGDAAADITVLRDFKSVNELSIATVTTVFVFFFIVLTSSSGVLFMIVASLTDVNDFSIVTSFSDSLFVMVASSTDVLLFIVTASSEFTAHDLTLFSCHHHSRSHLSFSIDIIHTLQENILAPRITIFILECKVHNNRMHESTRIFEPSKFLQ